MIACLECMCIGVHALQACATELGCGMSQREDVIHALVQEVNRLKEKVATLERSQQWMLSALRGLGLHEEVPPVVGNDVAQPHASAVVVTPLAHDLVLPRELWLHIFSLCTVSALLSIGCCCSRLHALVNCTPVWLWQVARYGLPPPPEHVVRGNHGGGAALKQWFLFRYGARCLAPLTMQKMVKRKVPDRDFWQSLWRDAASAIVPRSNVLLSVASVCHPVRRHMCPLLREFDLISGAVCTRVLPSQGWSHLTSNGRYVICRDLNGEGGVAHIWVYAVASMTDSDTIADDLPLGSPPLSPEMPRPRKGEGEGEDSTGEAEAELGGDGDGGDGGGGGGVVAVDADGVAGQADGAAVAHEDESVGHPMLRVTPMKHVTVPHPGATWRTQRGAVVAFGDSIYFSVAQPGKRYTTSLLRASFCGPRAGSWCTFPLPSSEHLWTLFGAMGKLWYLSASETRTGQPMEDQVCVVDMDGERGHLLGAHRFGSGDIPGTESVRVDTWWKPVCHGCDVLLRFRRLSNDEGAHSSHLLHSARPSNLLQEGVSQHVTVLFTIAIDTLALQLRNHWVSSDWTSVAMDDTVLVVVEQRQLTVMNKYTSDRIRALPIPSFTVLFPPIIGDGFVVLPHKRSSKQCASYLEFRARRGKKGRSGRTGRKGFLASLTSAQEQSSWTFVGSVTMEARALVSCASFDVHCCDLAITAASVLDGSSWVSIGHTVHPETQTMSLHHSFDADQEYRIRVTWRARVTSDLRGFYRCDGHDGPKAVTQFAPTDARRVFPCVDQPSAKSVFAVRLRLGSEWWAREATALTPPPVLPRPRDGGDATDAVATESHGGRDHSVLHHFSVLSNMPLVQPPYPVTSLEAQPAAEGGACDGSVWEWAFVDTPIMSSYLLAWCIGHFDVLQTTTSRGVHVGIFAPPGRLQDAELAKRVGVECLELFESQDVFDMAYPLDKVDLVAVKPFSYGAMENWGLITFRESALLVASNALSSRRKYVASVVAHELSHTYFGNLVTMQSWTDLWLNEGFATWFGSCWALTRLFPAWDTWLTFLRERFACALRLDSMSNTHAVRVHVVNSDDVNQIFDAISYSKGASVVRMLVDWLGHDVFMSGVRSYLRDHAYGNATCYDLWSALGTASGLPVATVAHRWVSCPGYPVVYVCAASETDASEESALTCLQLRQVPFESKASGSDTLWYIPLSILCFHCIDGVVTTSMLRVMLQDKTADVELPADVVAVKVNTGEQTFCRVSYSSACLQRLRPYLMRLSESDRMGVIRDTFDLSMANKANLVDALRFALAYRDETSYEVWTLLNNQIGYVQNTWSLEPYASALRSYCRALMHNLRDVGWWRRSSEPSHVVSLRPTALSTLGRAGDPIIVHEARKHFWSLMDDPGALSKSCSGVALRITLSQMDEETVRAFDCLLQRAIDCRDEQQHRAYLRALCKLPSARHMWILLQKALDPVQPLVSVENLYSLVSQVASNAACVLVEADAMHVESGPELPTAPCFLPFEWFRMHRGAISAALGSGSGMLGKVAGYACDASSAGGATDEFVAHVRAYFAQEPLPEGRQNIAQALEAMEIQLEQRRCQGPILASALGDSSSLLWWPQFCSTDTVRTLAWLGPECFGFGTCASWRNTLGCPRGKGSSPWQLHPLLVNEADYDPNLAPELWSSSHVVIVSDADAFSGVGRALIAWGAIVVATYPGATTDQVYAVLRDQSGPERAEQCTVLVSQVVPTTPAPGATSVLESRQRVTWLIGPESRAHIVSPTLHMLLSGHQSEHVTYAWMG